MTIAPIFEPEAWNLTEKQARLGVLARELAAEKFAPRAAHYDREAISDNNVNRPKHL